ncbi:alr0857 family protein [Calothrix sp. CCY 0018]|uniref:alr0857 family protein n=1 Tax=Calothrix sp. CCY 0018 TaxID=3103864 RepID=UPI0039C6B3B1
MLKLTYTDDKISLDCLKQSLEDWINTRVLISIRSTLSINIESSTASILVPASSFIGELNKINSENIVEFCHCDRESVEVVLKGIWLTSVVESETGVFVTELEEYTEYLLQSLFERELCTQT